MCSMTRIMTGAMMPVINFVCDDRSDYTADYASDYGITESGYS
ncbi:hypothetical protein [Nitratifractor sp.]